jgi:hypothetical protein
MKKTGYIKSNGEGDSSKYIFKNVLQENNLVSISYLLDAYMHIHMGLWLQGGATNEQKVQHIGTSAEFIF